MSCARHHVGGRLRGQECHTTHLTDADVIHIRALRAEGLTLVAIARRYGITKQSVLNIQQGRTWKHLEG